MIKKKTRNKFRICKIPRYLKGSVSPHLIKTDLVEYNAHRFKVFTAKARVDTKPPKMNPFNYINVRKLREDAERLKIIDQENKHILKAITNINKTIGRVDSYNPGAYATHSNWDSHAFRMKQIEENNLTMYDKIISANSSYGCETMKEFWSGIIEKLQLSSKFSLVILQKTSADVALAKQPSISGGLEKLAERPMCFLEFKVVDGEIIGRVEIELYHDYVPVTAQNFLSICTGDNKNKLSYKNCPVHRIVPGRFLETGDITLGTGRGGRSIYGKSFSEESHKLKHSRAGVLSMVRIKKHNNNSRFCVTFSSLEAMDKQNVVFGSIVKGVENLYKIEGYGRRMGKPLVPIIISDCGKLNLPPQT